MKSHHILLAFVPYSVALAVAEDFYSSVLLPRFPQGSLASTDGRCGVSYGNAICSGTEYGDCCSQKSFCGSSPAHCQEGCQSGFGSCEKTGGQSTSTSGNCGISGGFTLTCVGSQWGDCCSSGGFCGETSAYCGTGCNPLYGKCSGSTVSPAKSSTTKAASATSKPVQQAPSPSPQPEPQPETVVEQPPPESTSQVVPPSTQPASIAPPPPSSTGESSSLLPSSFRAVNSSPSAPTSMSSDSTPQVSVKTSEPPTSTASILSPTTSNSTLTPADPASSLQTTSSSPTASSIPSGGMTTGAKAGVAVGVIAALVAVFGILMFFLRKRRLAQAAAKDTQPPQYSAEVYDYKATSKLENEKNNYYEMDSRKAFNPNVAELPMSPEEESAAKERARIARIEDRVAAGYDGAYRGN